MTTTRNIDVFFFSARGILGLFLGVREVVRSAELSAQVLLLHKTLDAIRLPSAGGSQFAKVLRVKPPYVILERKPCFQRGGEFITGRAWRGRGVVGATWIRNQTGTGVF